MRRFPFVAELLIVAYLVANCGLTHSQNADQTAPKTRALKSVESDEPIFNPLAELLGIGSPLMPSFEDDISETIEGHRKAMDRAMDAHRQVMDNHKDTFGSIIEEQEKEIEDFHKHFEDLEKEFNEEFNKPMEEAFEHMAAPYMFPFGAQNVKEPTKTETKKNASKTELPVFHPMADSSPENLFSALFHDFQPVLKELHNDVRKRIDESEKAKQEEDNSEQMPFNFFGWDLNETLPEETNATELSDGGIVSDFLSTLIGSFGGIFANNGDRKDNEVNETQSSTSTSETTTSATENPVELWDRLTKKNEEYLRKSISEMDCGCPQGMHDIHEDDCPLKKDLLRDKELKANTPVNLVKADEEFAKDLEEMGNAIDFYRDTGYWPVDIVTKKSQSIDKLIEIENRLEARLRREWDIKDDQSPDQTTSSSPVAIQQMLQREIKIVTKNDNDYEWYDWTLIGLIAGISCLLMVIALFGCVQKSRKSKKAELPIKNAEEGVEQVVRLKVSKEKDNDKDGIANENVNNKYAEKIKTIFVNLK